LAQTSILSNFEDCEFIEEIWYVRETIPPILCHQSRQKRLEARHFTRQFRHGRVHVL